jgi:hypothetical protein
MHVTVTQAMIDEGKRLDCENCPIALAFSGLPGVQRAVIGVTTATITVAGNRHAFPLSKAMTVFIQAFDTEASTTRPSDPSRTPVKPTRFRLPIQVSRLLEGAACT